MMFDAFLNRPRLFEVLRSALDPGQVVHLRRLLGRVPYSGVLDLGCGTGGLSLMTDGPYLGVDLNPDYVRYARERYGSLNRRFAVADAMALGPELGRHDLVVLANVIHHFSDEGVLRILRGLSAVRPRNVLVVDVALDKVSWWFHAVFAPVDRGRYFRTVADQRILIGKAGLRIAWEDGYTSFPGIYPHSVLLVAWSGKGS